MVYRENMNAVRIWRLSISSAGHLIFILKKPLINQRVSIHYVSSKDVSSAGHLIFILKKT